jgi:hypothetical protein
LTSASTREEQSMKPAERMPLGLDRQGLPRVEGLRWRVGETAPVML